MLWFSLSPNAHGAVVIFRTSEFGDRRLVLGGASSATIEIRPTVLKRCSTWGNPKTALFAPNSSQNSTGIYAAEYYEWHHDLLYA